EMCENPDDRRLAIRSAGDLGGAELVPWLIKQMSDPAFARIAGEAFTQITGADFDRDYLKGEPPPDFVSGPNDDPDDDNVEVDPDENLPWPKLAAVEKWWAANGSRLPKTRLFMGKPLEIDWLQSVLRQGRQRQRAAAAIELALRQPDQPL